CPVSSTTANRRSSRSSCSLLIFWKPIASPMNIGMKAMPMMNALLLTSIEASEPATISALLGRRMLGAWSGDAHEDVVQRGARDLEVVHRRARHEPREERLRVAAQPHLLRHPVVVHVVHLRE